MLSDHFDISQFKDGGYNFDKAATANNKKWH